MALSQMIMRTADFSACRKYRYTLWRNWSDGGRYVNFICLNPSTADETNDDPTMRKCIKFAKAWGYDAMCATNIFAYRATDPKEMKRQAEPIGESNDYYIHNIAHNAALVVAAWSQHGTHLERSKQVREILTGLDVHMLKMGSKEPWHPLYLKDSTVPVPFSTPETRKASAVSGHFRA